MKNTLLKFITLLIASNFWSAFLIAQKTGSAQMTSEKIEKLIERQKRQIENDKEMSPVQKQRLMQMLNRSVGEKTAAKTDDLPQQPINIISNKTRLAGIPPKVLTDMEVKNFLQEMSKKLELQLSAKEKDFVTTAMSKCDKNSVKLSNISVATWYSGNDKAALMIALKAAGLSQSDAALNNVAAILNLSGYEEKAVPILQYLLKKYPENSTVLNNIGQSFYGLGVVEKAKKFFLQCISKSPNHPEACNSMGLIFLKAGNSAAALDYFEQSLKGGYNKSARNTLEQLNAGYNFIPLEESHFARPADIPDLDIVIPDLPYDVYSLNIIGSKHEKFRQKMTGIITDLDNKITIESAKEPAEILAQENAGIQVPFTEPGMDLYGHYMIEEKSVLLRKDSAIRIRLNDARLKYETQFDKIMKDNSGDYCKKINELRSRKQNEASSIYKDFMGDYRETALQYLNKELGTLPLIATCEAGYKALYYRAISDYLSELRGLSIGAPFEVNCNGLPDINTADFRFDPKLHPICRYKAVIPFIIGSMKFDCSTFEFEGGEILKLGVKRDFTTNQTTLAVGVGVSIETPITELGAQQSFYVSFNDNQQPTDIGMKGEAKATVGAGITTESGLEYTMGMNSGIDVTATLTGRSFKL